MNGMDWIFLFDGESFERACVFDGEPGKFLSARGEWESRSKSVSGCYVVVFYRADVMDLFIRCFSRVVWLLGDWGMRLLEKTKRLAGTWRGMGR